MSSREGICRVLGGNCAGFRWGFVGGALYFVCILCRGLLLVVFVCMW